ncbi:hypothetical protein T8A63_19475 (plasmid) [Sulfitobacter sp. OXR-159]|uniref:hypothetical protein n=1 Tax=Sulfitobacter sp. OXR-159 TaxID=3100174 RepID=UPI002AC9C5A3|nr:hypothetical protein [Sulfitobacter sp. OXR-159]WPZ31682.1 hypothetical protein T8A63_19475 [Sulfitobacter sp. OXR-159]
MSNDISALPAPLDAQQELLDQIPRLPILPGENAAAFEDLRQALLSELNPSSPYQMSLAENLIALEWEIHRHRSLSEGLLRKHFREAAQEVWEKDLLGAFSQFGEASSEAKDFAEGLLDPLSEQSATSLAWLEERNIGVSEIAAAAYENAGRALVPHETKLADLEIRRRRLREDYDRLKVANTRPIEDAQFVAGHGD